MSTMPLEALQLRALQQRSQLHKTASDLRTNLSRTRKKLSLPRQVHDHLLAVSLIVGAIALVSGYGLAGLFSNR